MIMLRIVNNDISDLDIPENRGKIIHFSRINCHTDEYWKVNIWVNRKVNNFLSLVGVFLIATVS